MENKNFNIFDYTYNGEICNAYFKCRDRFSEYNNILIAISGGSDSDIMLDLSQKVLQDSLFNDINPPKITYVFFDTGIEYKATKEHLDYLEKKYNIEIKRIKATTPVPLGCKLYGLPFLSKYVSEMLDRMQKHNFNFKEDGWKDYDTLLAKYKTGRGWLVWWCNKNKSQPNKKSHFNINNNKFLKEFLIENPPDFKISQKCCKGAKKDPSKTFEEENEFDLKLMGLRKVEGGIRSTAYHNCFEYKRNEKMQNFRPIWWFKDSDKEIYEKTFDIKHSDCYAKYGFTRTGCSCCPFGSTHPLELETVKRYEPQLYTAVQNIFGKSYEYTKKYKEFKEKMKSQEKQGILKNQISIFDKNSQTEK